jgi:hypothetical protein
MPPKYTALISIGKVMTENGKARHQGKDAKDARQGRKARHQGKMAKDGKARQGTQGRKASACHRHAIIGIIIGMPSASACRQGIIIGIGKACHHRHRQVKASARHRHAIVMPSSASAGRRTQDGRTQQSGAV